MKFGPLILSVLAASLSAHAQFLIDSAGGIDVGKLENFVRLGQVMVQVRDAHIPCQDGSKSCEDSIVKAAMATAEALPPEVSSTTEFDLSAFQSEMHAQSLGAAALPPAIVEYFKYAHPETAEYLPQIGWVESDYDEVITLSLLRMPIYSARSFDLDLTQIANVRTEPTLWERVRNVEIPKTLRIKLLQVESDADRSKDGREMIWDLVRFSREQFRVMIQLDKKASPKRASANPEDILTLVGLTEEALHLAQELARGTYGQWERESKALQAPPNGEVLNQASLRSEWRTVVQLGGGCEAFERKAGELGDRFLGDDLPDTNPNENYGAYFSIVAQRKLRAQAAFARRVLGLSEAEFLRAVYPAYSIDIDEFAQDVGKGKACTYNRGQWPLPRAIKRNIQDIYRSTLPLRPMRPLHRARTLHSLPLN